MANLTKQELRDAAEAEYKKVQGPAYAEYEKRIAEIDAMPAPVENPLETLRRAQKLLEENGFIGIALTWDKG